MLNVKLKKLVSEAIIPKYANIGDAGMDVTAISKNETEKYIEYGTGLSFQIPKGYMMLVFPRSSISNTDLIMANSVGVLDAGYRGELKLRFRKSGEHDYAIGERVGQIIILPFPEVNFEETESLEESMRGEGGFGSSGKN